MNILLIFVLTGLMNTLRSFSTGDGTTAGVSLALGYLLLTAYFAGGTFQRLRLPKLTGYVVTGILVGPHVLGLLNEQMLASLKVVNGVAVALIAMTAGSELEIATLKPIMRWIWGITSCALLVAGAFLTLAIIFARPWLPFMNDMSSPQIMAVAMVLGVVMVAQSPAVVIALRDEMLADGPVSRTVLGVVVLADLIVILLFALTSAAAKAALGAGADILDTLLALGWELLGSLVVGAGIGYVLGLYLRKVQSGAALFLLIVAFIIAEVGQRIYLDPLLIALAAGMLVRNTTRVGAELHGHIEWSAVPVYTLFFAVAGANLQLSVLAVVGGLAVVLVLTRAAGLLLGAYIGARLAGAPERVRRHAGFGLLPQSGLALALSMLFGKTFPEFGAEAGALTLGIVALNELVAPTIYRLALVKSGEAGQRQPVPLTRTNEAEAAAGGIPAPHAHPDPLQQ